MIRCGRPYIYMFLPVINEMWYRFKPVFIFTFDMLIRFTRLSWELQNALPIQDAPITLCVVSTLGLLISVRTCDARFSNGLGMQTSRIEIKYCLFFHMRDTHFTYYIYLDQCSGLTSCGTSLETLLRRLITYYSTFDPTRSVFSQDSGSRVRTMVPNNWYSILNPHDSMAWKKGTCESAKLGSRARTIVGSNRGGYVGCTSAQYNCSPARVARVHQGRSSHASSSILDALWTGCRRHGRR